MEESLKTDWRATQELEFIENNNVLPNVVHYKCRREAIIDKMDILRVIWNTAQCTRFSGNLVLHGYFDFE